MNNQNTNKQKPEITRIYLSHFLHQLNSDYEKIKEQLETLINIGNDDFVKVQILEELEKLTINIQRYAIRIYSKSQIEDKKTAITNLENMQVFNTSTIAEFFFFTNNNYQEIKSYIKMLDYLRLLILEYLYSN